MTLLSADGFVIFSLIMIFVMLTFFTDVWEIVKLPVFNVFDIEIYGGIVTSHNCYVCGIVCCVHSLFINCYYFLSFYCICDVKLPSPLYGWDCSVVTDSYGCPLDRLAGYNCCMLCCYNVSSSTFLTGLGHIHKAPQGKRLWHWIMTKPESITKFKDFGKLQI